MSKIVFIKEIVVCRRWYVQRDMGYVEDGMCKGVCSEEWEIRGMSKGVIP